MNKVIFEISQLECSYNKGRTKVLSIPKLELSSGKLIFLLGASGSGKSTLLETLGLMNSTISSGSVIFTPLNGSNLSYADLWSTSKNAAISETRKKYFSFIFQETNLMGNFTAYENVCLARMIKESKNQSQVVNEVYELMDRVRLPQREVNTGTIAMNLSGGQRQRLAFVRALSSHASVLFCDEPTGNLDERNANDLFEVIKENVGNNSSAIVVSHSVDLALKHADQIILLTKDGEKQYGEILPENVIDRNYWSQFSPDELEKFKTRIVNTFVPGADHKRFSTNGAISKTDFTHNFRQLFVKRESTALAGKRFVNFFVMSAIALLSFVAIGFANGSLRYLDNLWNNAFVNWLPIVVPYTRGSETQINKIKEDLADPTLKSQFGYSTISAYTIPRLIVKQNVSQGLEILKGITFDLQGDGKFLDQEIFSRDNLVRGQTKFKNDKDVSLIVTQEVLKDMGYSEDALFLNAKFSDRDSATGQMINFEVPIPILAIVKTLPNKSTFGCTEYFWKSWMKTNTYNSFNPTLKTDELIFFASTDSANAANIYSIFRKYMTAQDASYGQYGPKTYSPEADTVAGIGGYYIRIDFLSSLPSYKDIDTLSLKLLSVPEISEYKSLLHKTYFYGEDLGGELPRITYDVLSVYFSSLDNVRSFSEYIKGKYNERADLEHRDVDLIQVDTSKIKDKENFNFLSKITLIIAYLIIIFGNIAVSLFIFNLLKMHLNKVKMNIGTFKAIGLSNNESRNVYFTIMLMFILASLILGFGLAFGIGTLIDGVLRSNMVLNKKECYFHLFALNSVMAGAIFILTSMLVSWFTINRMLSKSPGDLIYNR